MPLVRESAVTPVEVGDIQVNIFNPAPDTDATWNIVARAQVRMSDGQVVERRMVISDLFTPEAIALFGSMVAALRVVFVQRILPEESQPAIVVPAEVDQAISLYFEGENDG